MRPRAFDFDPADELLTGYASNVTGATWALTATSSGDSLAHQVSIRNDTANDHSTKTAVLTGTDADGRAQTETINLPVGSATVESTKYFLTLTTVVPSATIGVDTMDIGWVDEFASQTMPLDSYRNIGPTVGLNVTGTISLTVQLTNNNPQLLGETAGIPAANQLVDQESMLWIDDDNLAAVTTDSHGRISDWPMKAIRLISVSYSSGAEVQMTFTSAYS